LRPATARVEDLDTGRKGRHSGGPEWMATNS